MSWPERIEPGPGQESVWEYPRPPRLETVNLRLRVEFAGLTIADTVRSHRVLETSHPPCYYFPPDDVFLDHLSIASGSSICEWKGRARYWTITVGDKLAESAGWSYHGPTPAFADIDGHIAFYASKVDACWVGDERVIAQEGDFYGGWITANIVGPFKGPPGTRGW